MQPKHTEAAAAFGWDSLPEHVQALVTDKLSPADAARASAVDRNLRALAAGGPQWAELLRGPEGLGPLPKHPKRWADAIIAGAMNGPFSQQALRAMLSRRPTALPEFLASDDFLEMKLLDWRARETEGGSTQAAEAARRILHAKVTSANKLDLSFLDIATLPEGLGQLTQLHDLRLLGCKRLAALPASIGQLKKLKYLHISSSERLKVLPDELGELTQLLKLGIHHCRHLTALPEAIGQLTQLVVLRCDGCANLESLPQGLGQLIRLRVLFLSSCARMTTLPESLGQLTGLMSLTLSRCANLTSLPDSVGQLQQLRWLYLNECAALTALPESLGQLAQLQTLTLAGSTHLRGTPLPAGLEDRAGLLIDMP